MNRPPKIDRKTLKNPDEFVKRGQVLIDVIAKYQKLLLGLLGVLLLTAAGTFGYRYFEENRLEKGWTEYYAASKKIGDQRQEALKKVWEGYGTSRPGNFAAVAIADFHFDEAKKEGLKEGGNVGPAAASAVDWYTKALAFSGLDATESQLILINRGSAKETAGQVDEALSDYQAASDKDGLARPLAYLSLGRAYELKNQNDKAIESYQKVPKGEGEAETEYFKLARTYLRRLKSPLFQQERS